MPLHRFTGRDKTRSVGSLIRTCARFAVASLDNPTAKNAEIEVGGPEALSSLEVVKIFEELGGKAFTLQHVSEEQLRAQKEQSTDPLQESFAGLMLSLRSGKCR